MAFWNRNRVGPGSRPYMDGGPTVPRWTNPPERNTEEWIRTFRTNPRLAVVERIASDLSFAEGKLFRVDENGDGGCDVCGHSNYVEQPEPEPELEPDPTPELGGTDSSDDSEGGCGGVIAIGAGSIVLAGAAISAAVVAVRKKRKE